MIVPIIVAVEIVLFITAVYYTILYNNRVAVGATIEKIDSEDCELKWIYKNVQYKESFPTYSTVLPLADKSVGETIDIFIFRKAPSHVDLNNRTSGVIVAMSLSWVLFILIVFGTIVYFVAKRNNM